jgi:hypothetical protein
MALESAHGGQLMIVRRLSPLSFAKVSGIVYAILGMIAGVMFALFSHDGGGRGPGGGFFNAVFGVGALLFMPIAHGVMGFVLSLILAALYNVVAMFVGGIEIQTDQER